CGGTRQPLSQRQHDRRTDGWVTTCAPCPGTDRSDQRSALVWHSVGAEISHMPTSIRLECGVPNAIGAAASTWATIILGARHGKNWCADGTHFNANGCCSKWQSPD